MNRRAFTLVEMLVVVTIIGILAMLITAAAISARRRAKIATIGMEISQLDMAFKAFKERFGEYPPDFGSAAATNVIEMNRFVSRAFPRCTRIPTNVGSLDRYNPGMAMVFWLGGRYDTTNKRYIGFSADPTNPFDLNENGTLATPCPSRIGPFFDFDLTRIQRYYDTGAAPYTPYYWPPGVATPPTYLGSYSSGYFPYLYYRAENGSYANKGFPYPLLPAMKDTRLSGNKVATTVYMNPNSFQIRCCGLDGKFGVDSNKEPYGTWFPLGINPTTDGPTPSGPDYFPENYDDMGNFCSGTFEDNIPP